MTDMNVTEYSGQGIPVKFTFEPGGEIAGPNKVAQSWIKMFLTEQGSQQYTPDAGTIFLQAMRNGNILRANDVTFNFNNASTRIAKLLANDELTQALPNSEQLATAELVDFNILPEQSLLQLRVKLTTKAGDTVLATVPVVTS